MIWTGLTISPAREQVVDFSYPFWEESIGVFTTTKAGDQFFIFRPLSMFVWICFIGMSVATAVSIRYLESFYAKYRADCILPFTRLDVCLWYTLGGMWNQGMMYCDMAFVNSGKA